MLFTDETQKPKTVPDTLQILKYLFNKMNKEMAITINYTTWKSVTYLLSLIRQKLIPMWKQHNWYNKDFIRVGTLRLDFLAQYFTVWDIYTYNLSKSQFPTRKMRIIPSPNHRVVVKIKCLCNWKKNHELFLN